MHSPFITFGSRSMIFLSTFRYHEIAITVFHLKHSLRYGTSNNDEHAIQGLVKLVKSATDCGFVFAISISTHTHEELVITHTVIGVNMLISLALSSHRHFWQFFGVNQH